MDGLLGVAGIMKLIVSQWIIPEHSLRLAQVSNTLRVPGYPNVEKQPSSCGINRKNDFQRGIQQGWKGLCSVSKPCTSGEHQNSWDLWM